MKIEQNYSNGFRVINENTMPFNNNPDEYFKKINEIIITDKFLNREGYSEVPFFICPYDPKISIEMDRIRDVLLDNLKIKGIKALDINLYKLCLNILEKENILKTILEEEENIDKVEFKESLQSILNPQDIITKQIKNLLEQDEYKIVFLSGIGEVFPYIRSHNILNNLQLVIKHIPMLMFFPGEYIYTETEGTSLRLFKTMLDDRYYRAFDITQYIL